MRWALLAFSIWAFAAPADAQMRLVSATPRNGEPAAPAYVDRMIEGLAPQAEEPEEEKAYNREGWPRFLRLETRLGTEPTAERKLRAGMAASGAIETPNHGVISVDATIAPNEGRSAVTLRQRGLPLAGGGLMNNELGVSTPVGPPIMRVPARVFVPSVVTNGASTEWLGAGGAIFQASSGELGRLQGYPVPGFLPLAGTVSLLGIQGILDGWTVAARHAYANKVSLFDDPPAGFAPITSHSTHLAARRESGNYALQANVVAARSTETSGGRYGAWVEGEQRLGGSTQGWGFFRLDTHLSWAGQPMASDIEGAYLRGSWNTRRWSAQGSVDLLRSISGPDDVGVLVTSSGQWRYSRTLSLGAGGTVRRYLGDAGSGFADVRWEHDWGRTGLRGELSRFDRERSRRLILDHDWPLPLGWTMGTSLSGGREYGSERAGSLLGASISLAAPLSSNASLLANASVERRGNGDRYESANVSLQWQLERHWTLEGNLYYTRGRQRLTTPIDPLAPLPERFATTTDTHAVYLVLRYEDRAGSRATPLGGMPQSGGGSIAGVVFLDANRNGTREAGEAGAAGVTVQLDGRYAVRTDAQGRFEFPFVASGTRVVSVLNETLPLPWEIGERAERRVEVRVRESAELLIAVVRRAD